MEKYVNRLMAAYYEACKQGEKKRAAILYKKLYNMGVVLIPY